jgi:hypothetical protein
LTLRVVIRKESEGVCDVIVPPVGKQLRILARDSPNGFTL